MDQNTEISFSEKMKECVSFLRILADQPELWVDLKEEEKIELMKIAGHPAIAKAGSTPKRELILCWANCPTATPCLEPSGPVLL